MEKKCHYRVGSWTVHFTLSGIMKVHPVIVNLESARKHYKSMADGRQRIVLNYRKLGKVLIGRGKSSCDQFPEVKLVTPAAMAAEQARATIKRQRKGRKKPAAKRQQKGGSQKKKKQQPIRRQQKKKKPQKKTIKRKAAKPRAQSKKRQQRDNFS